MTDSSSIEAADLYVFDLAPARAGEMRSLPDRLARAIRFAEQHGFTVARVRLELDAASCSIALTDRATPRVVVRTFVSSAQVPDISRGSRRRVRVARDKTDLSPVP